MNITYLIGNGLDIHYNLKTSYQDFYNEYLKKKAKTDNVQILKDCITQDEKAGKKLWKDLEIGLGDITAKYQQVADFLEAYEDISNELRIYINEQENTKLQISDEITKKFYNDLISPHTHLRPASYSKLSSYLDAFANFEWHINVVTFNYTSSLEKILNYKEGSIELGNNKYGKKVYLDNIKHLHGSCHDTILLGVNDISQISNEAFKKDPNLTDVLIKIRANVSMENLMTEACTKYIDDSNLICCYGLSMGPTDKYWWDTLSKVLSRTNGKLIIFEHRENLDISKKEYYRGKIKREVIKNLLSNSSIKDESLIEKIAQNVYVGINEKIFYK